jgi:hypothetical protein
MVGLLTNRVTNGSGLRFRLPANPALKMPPVTALGKVKPMKPPDSQYALSTVLLIEVFRLVGLFEFSITLA